MVRTDMSLPTPVQPPPAELVSHLKRELDQDLLRYMLRMYWLGRADKIHRDLMPALAWVTKHCVPGYARGSREFSPGAVLFKDADHHKLADDTVTIVSGALARVEN